MCSLNAHKIWQDVTQHEKCFIHKLSVVDDDTNTRRIDWMRLIYWCNFWPTVYDQDENVTDWHFYLILRWSTPFSCESSRTDRIFATVDLPIGSAVHVQASQLAMPVPECTHIVSVTCVSSRDDTVHALYDETYSTTYFDILHRVRIIRCYWFFCCNFYKHRRLFTAFRAQLCKRMPKYFGARISCHTFVLLLLYRVKVSDTDVTHFAQI